MPAQEIRSLEDTFWIIQHVHIGMCHDKKYRKRPFNERDKIIGKKMRLDQGYVASARMGIGDFREFSDKVDPYIANSSLMSANKLMEIVQCSYINLRKEKEFENSPSNVLDKITAGWLGYGESYMRNARVGGGDFRKLRGCVDERCRERKCGNSKRTFERVREIYLARMNKKGFSELPKLEKDTLVAKISNLSMHTVEAIRNGNGTYKKHGNLYHKNY